MTNDEKRKLAIARELDELRKCVRNFDEVVESARRLADDCRDSLARFQAIERETVIDEKIDDLDKLTGRGIYRSNNDFLGTMSILDNVLLLNRKKDIS